MDQQNSTQQHSPSTTATRRVDMAQAQKEADELSRMAQTIPADVTRIREGMLPKDVLEKLKQIEKLSKHLRSDIAR
jgi:hypothetical protein